MAGANGNGSDSGVNPKIGTDVVKCGLAQMLKGGVIVSEVNCSSAPHFSFDPQTFEVSRFVLLTHYSGELIAT